MEKQNQKDKEIKYLGMTAIQNAPLYLARNLLPLFHIAVGRLPYV